MASSDISPLLLGESPVEKLIQRAARVTYLQDQRTLTFIENEAREEALQGFSVGQF